MTEQEFNKVLDSASKRLPPDLLALFRRAFCARTHLTHVGAQGRIHLPSDMLHRFLRAGEVTLLGLVSRFEIWDVVAFGNYIGEQDFLLAAGERGM